MTQEAVVEISEQLATQCRHHWIIESASGPTSKGVCRLCGAEKQFLNYVGQGSWDDDRPSYREASRKSSRSLVLADRQDVEEEP